MDIEVFAKLLQFSISPIALISGASLLLLSITNRLGRTIDRSRILVRELESGPAGQAFKASHTHQLRILARRSQKLRHAVLFISCSIFLSSLMIATACLQAFMGWEVKSFVLTLLFSSVLSICVAMIFFVLDVTEGLHALHLEVGRHI